MKFEQIAIKTTYFSLLSNIFLAIIKGLAGFFGNSYALIADAIESTTDVGASILVLFGLKYAKKPADKNHPYGHGKIEPLITFLVVFFLIFAAIVIIYKSIINIQTPHKSPKGWTLFVLAAIIIWKELSYRFVIKKSKETKSTALKADAWHHRSDAITSVVAFIGISISLLFGPGLENADDWAAIFAALFIFYNTYTIFRPALAEIMDENLHEELIREIREIATTVEGIVATEKCYVRKSGTVYQVDLHAVVDGEISVHKGHELSHNLEDTLKEKIPNLGHVIIHIEPDDAEHLSKSVL
ncbi:cation diffusion facilitator family transporter [Flavobacteriaceae bacterium F08102]|nr:cation diffusion facilitator family transporter [Flavobacteriaceae bacterium F08102]